MRVLITMLPSTQHVQEVYTGSDGILAADGKPFSRTTVSFPCALASSTGKLWLSAHAGGLRPSLLIDCSTISPVEARELSQKAVESARLHQGAAPYPGCSNRSATMVDAPVSGGVPGARAATLTFMVGCCSNFCVTRHYITTALHAVDENYLPTCAVWRGEGSI